MATTGTKVLRALEPDLYRTNAFRVAELHVEASTVDFRKRLEKVQIMEKLGMQPESANSCIALVPSPSAAAVRAAIERLADPEHRILEEVFWLWPLEQGTASQDRALLALKQRELNPAVAIWQRRCADNTDEVAIHNLAVLYHARALDAEGNGAPDLDELWGKAWRYWRLLEGHAPFWKRLQRRIEDLDDPRLTSHFVSRLHNDLILLLSGINVQLAYKAASNSNTSALSRHMALLGASGLGNVYQLRLIEAALQPVRDSLNTYAAHVDDQARENPAQSDKVIRKYLEDVHPLLSTVSLLLPKGNSIRDGCHDQVATTVRGLLIGFGNSTKNWHTCREILRECKSIAVSASAVSFIDEDLKTVTEKLEASLCWFCKQGEPATRSKARIPMHGDTQTEYYGSGTRYRWRTKEVEIPRCKRCLWVHLARRFALALVLGLASLVFVWSEESSLIAIVFTIALFIGWQTGPFLRSLPLDRLFGLTGSGTLPEREKQKFPLVAYLKSAGWESGSRPSSVGIEPKVLVKGFLWVVIFIVIAVVFSSVKDDSSAASSTPANRPSSYNSSVSPMATSVPTSSSQAGSSATTPAPNRSLQVPSPSEVRELKSEIDSSRARLNQLEAVIEDCKTTIAGYNEAIASDRSKLEQMEADDRSGLYVNNDDYELIRSRHNRNVRLHNDKVHECQDIVQEHDSFVDRFNANVHEYNRLAGAR